MWPSAFFNYDLIHDLLNARRLLETGSLPVHGSVASFGVFNPPGVAFGLLPGYGFFPTEPALAMHSMTIFLSALAVAGIFLFLSRRFGWGIAVWACLIYLVSSTGCYFIAEMRPRAHPVFVIWILFFLDLWVSERKAWAAFPVIFLQAAAMYWMLEITPFLLAIAAAVALYRAPIRWRWIAAGAALSLGLWFPYLKFQYERGFLDLRVLLVEQKSHMMGQWFPNQLAEKGLQRTIGYRSHTIPDYLPAESPAPATAVNPPVAPASFLKRLHARLAPAFPVVPSAGILAVLIGSIIAGCCIGLRMGKSREQADADELPRRRTHAILSLTALLCGGSLFYHTFGQSDDIVIRRFLWLWTVFAMLLVLGVRRLMPLLIKREQTARFAANGVLALLAGALSLNPTLVGNGFSWVEHGFGTVPPGEFNEVIDITAQAIRENGLPPRIGYDLPFIEWAPAVWEIDGTSSIGVQYDLMLSFRHGIENLNTGPIQVSPDDSIRIVEHASPEPWRQSYLNLSGYPAMEVFTTLERYTILIRKNSPEKD